MERRIEAVRDKGEKCSEEVVRSMCNESGESPEATKVEPVPV
jgi:hypothetical protein